MPEPKRWVEFALGSEVFAARTASDLSAQSCRQLLELLPYRGKAIHARWSGEALWSPLGVTWSSGALPAERAVHQPEPGQILIYAGPVSEPELLIPYGPTRFACRFGPLEGNLVLTLEEGHSRLAELGREVLWRGALDLRIE